MSSRTPSIWNTSHRMSTVRHIIAILSVSCCVYCLQTVLQLRQRTTDICQDFYFDLTHIDSWKQLFSINRIVSAESYLSKQTFGSTIVQWFASLGPKLRPTRSDSTGIMNTACKSTVRPNPPIVLAISRQCFSTTKHIPDFKSFAGRYKRLANIDSHRKYSTGAFCPSLLSVRQ